MRVKPVIVSATFRIDTEKTELICNWEKVNGGSRQDYQSQNIIANAFL